MNRNDIPGKRFQRRYGYYEILEISKNATQEEIRKAFRHLAQKYHPDRNPGNSEAEAKFKKINEAYQVLSNPAERTAYDSSPAECPACGTYKVVEKAGSRWWCTVCGCEFDAFGIPLSEKIERATISERYRARLTAFQSMQCSWCRKFFTQPFLCPDRKLHSSCFVFDKLSKEERGKLLNNEKWWWRIVDLVRQAENNGVIKKCVNCGVLNPNPEQNTCWNCKHNIYDRCPKCGLPTLYFDLDDNVWKCANARDYGKRFTFDKLAVRTKKPAKEPVKESVKKPIKESVKKPVKESVKKPAKEPPVYVLRGRCPDCKSDLRFDFARRFWRCTKCQRIYTYKELRKASARKAKSRQTLILAIILIVLVTVLIIWFFMLV